MTGRMSRLQDQPGPRHAPDWYDQRGELVVLEVGDRMIIQCEGGPCSSRLERFPPRLEIEETHGMYVLRDDGPRVQWTYEFVPREA